MTVTELIQHLSTFPPEMEVRVYCEEKDSQRKPAFVPCEVPKTYQSLPRARWEEHYKAKDFVII